MAFVCTAAEETAHADFFRDGSDYLVNIHIGYDNFLDLNYSALIGLSPAPPVGEMEFFFTIVEVNGINNSEEQINDGRKTASFVNEEDRKKILISILSASRALILHINPDRFFMATRDACLPEKALKKYHMLLEVFRGCGYVISAADPYHGRQLWWMARSEASQ